MWKRTNKAQVSSSLADKRSNQSSSYLYAWKFGARLTQRYMHTFVNIRNNY